MTAHEALERELVAMAHDGTFPPCMSDPDAWVSDSRDTRAIAANICASCPALDACRTAGDLERWGVWGGVDRTPNRTKGLA